LARFPVIEPHVVLNKSILFERLKAAVFGDVPELVLVLQWLQLLDLLFGAVRYDVWPGILGERKLTHLLIC